MKGLAVNPHHRGPLFKRVTQTPRWKREGDSRIFKLVKPDLEEDKLFTSGLFKVNPKDPKDTSKAVRAIQDNERLLIGGVANANIVDRVQERVDPRGCITEHYLKNPQFLAHHSYYDPVGRVESLDIQDDGVHFAAWIGDPVKAPLTQMQIEMRSLVAQEVINTVSIGFIPWKIRAPLYNDTGEMEEPCVIEQWELLEISLVAVPCNQGAYFQMRSQPPGAGGTKESPQEVLERVTSDNMVVQTLVFDKAVFSESQSIEWAKDHGFNADKLDVTETTYRVRQLDPSDCEENSFKTIDVTKGVQAVTATPKKKEGEGSGEGGGSSGGSDQVVAALTKLEEQGAKSIALLEKIAAKLDASSDESTQDPPKETEEGKAINERLEKLEKNFDKLVKNVSILVKQSKEKPE